jgi:VanZ family protein
LEVIEITALLYENRRSNVRSGNPKLSQVGKRAVLPLLWMGAIFFFSAQSDLNSHLGLIDFIGRKLVHMASFGTLAYLWFWTLRGAVPRPMLIAVVIAVLYACSDEWHQSFVEGRHGTPVDVVIDSVGIAAAAWFANRQGKERRS